MKFEKKVKKNERLKIVHFDREPLLKFIEHKEAKLGIRGVYFFSTFTPLS